MYTKKVNGIIDCDGIERAYFDKTINVELQRIKKKYKNRIFLITCVDYKRAITEIINKHFSQKQMFTFRNRNTTNTVRGWLCQE